MCSEPRAHPLRDRGPGLASRAGSLPGLPATRRCCRGRRWPWLSGAPQGAPRRRGGCCSPEEGPEVTSEATCCSASASPRRGPGPAAGAERAEPVPGDPSVCPASLAAHLWGPPLPAEIRVPSEKGVRLREAESLPSPAATLLAGSVVEPGVCAQRRPVVTGAWPRCWGRAAGGPRGRGSLGRGDGSGAGDRVSGGTCESCLRQAIGDSSRVVCGAASALGLFAAGSGRPQIRSPVARQDGGVVWRKPWASPHPRGHPCPGPPLSRTGHGHSLPFIIRTQLGGSLLSLVQTRRGLSTLR